MLENAFIGRTTKPTETDLGTALGAAKVAWDEVLAGLAAELGADIHEWKCHSPKWGWSLCVLRKRARVRRRGCRSTRGLEPGVVARAGGLSANPVPVYLVVTSLLVGTALPACWLPARRATRLDPVDALRAE